MASRTAARGAGGLKALQTGVMDGAKAVIATESLATVGGFALSRVAERTLWGAFRGTFGAHTDTETPTEAQQFNRTLSKVAMAIAAGGFIVASRDKHIRAAGVGLMAGLTWHALNDLGINV